MGSVEEIDKLISINLCRPNPGRRENYFKIIKNIILTLLCGASKPFEATQRSVKIKI